MAFSHSLGKDQPLERLSPQQHSGARTIAMLLVSLVVIALKRAGAVDPLERRLTQALALACIGEFGCKSMCERAIQINIIISPSLISF